jgi:hypothetical protein
MNTTTLNMTTLDGGNVIIKRGEGGGATINNQDKVVDITENGTTEVVADGGYTGLGKVTINTEVSGGGGSNVEYLDLSGGSPLRDALVSFCYLIKTSGFNIEHPDSSSWSAGRGIIPAGNLIPTMVGMTYDDYSIVMDSIKAVAVDFNTEIVMQDVIMPIEVVFTGAEELLNAIPRLTKEQFYTLE